MGNLIRSMNWSKTPLGPRQSWPQSLRTIVSLCLASNFPIAIAWGPERTQLYNDGYWPLCGAKHPHSMGADFRECWLSAWPVIGSAFDQASAGQTAFLENQRMFLDRYGYLEETFFTFSFSPIRDESGTVSGLFHPVTELTQQTLAERRLRVLRTLADSTGDARTVDQAVTRVISALAGFDLDLPFIAIYLIDDKLKEARLAGSTGLQTGTPANPALIALEAPDGRSWPLARVMRSQHSEQVDNLAQRFGPLFCGAYPEPMQTALVMPIILSAVDHPFGVLIAGVSTRRPLDNAYRTFYDLLQGGVTNAFSNALGYELERQRAEALAEVDRAKTAFFSNVSHEFRTPLTLMLGPLTEALQDPSRPLAEIDRERLDLAHRNALRLLKLVNSLLDFARIEAGRTQVAYRPIDLAMFTRELAGMFTSAIEGAEIEFTVDCPPLPEPVYVDSDMWEKIVLNLISNAFKFTFTGSIAVRLRWLDGNAVLTVSDTGIGVPAEHIPRLFERFHRVPNARSRTNEGTGIGLALVHELVKLHGGTIRVNSVLDQGTDFTVTVPGGTAHLPADRIGANTSLTSTAIDARAFVQEAESWLPNENGATPVTNHTSVALGMPASESRHRRPRILWADDNADMRRYVRGLLTPYWDVEAVADGVRALEAARREPPDLVLTDIMMPNLDGFGLLQALRADERTRETPVIMLSARAGEEARVEGLEAGADDYLVKPFGARELLARVRTHLDIAHLRQHAVMTAQHDPLTRLPNRALTYEFGDRLLAGARRGDGRCAVLFIDMDRFKPINDTYGHEAGDAALKEMALRLKACVRSEDTLGRVGGDEFLIILSHIHHPSDAVHAARQVISKLGAPYRVGNLELHSSPSIGISLFPDNGADLDMLVRNADAAMYHAKECGGNNFQFYTDALNESTMLALRIENGLRIALEHDEFQLHYQPIVDTSTHSVVGAEALLRWPVLEISPDCFIPVAEKSGMIDQIGGWVIHEVCRQARQWQDQGWPALSLSFNVSPLQFRQLTLPDVIAHALSEHGIEPSSLTVELTETTLLKNADEAILIMRAVKELGLKIALDDFGKGYSSLSHLGRLPLDTVKIDQDFVHALATNPASVAITEAIIGIGKTLGLRVIAEGIESAETLALLRNKNCHEMQGYYLCPPVSASEFEHWRHHWVTA